MYHSTKCPIILELRLKVTSLHGHGSGMFINVFPDNYSGLKIRNVLHSLGLIQVEALRWSKLECPLGNYLNFFSCGEKGFQVPQSPEFLPKL